MCPRAGDNPGEPAPPKRIVRYVRATGGTTTGAWPGWPSDMTISVKWDDEVLALLYSAEVLGVPLRAPLVPAPKGASIAPEREPGVSWVARWETHWTAALQFAIDLGRISANVAAGRPYTEPTVPSKWLPQLGWPEAEFTAWKAELPMQSSEFGKAPEYLVGDALVDAWRAGLRTIILLPHSEVFGDRVESDAMLLTHAARAHPGWYAAVLQGCWGDRA